MTCANADEQAGLVPFRLSRLFPINQVMETIMSQYKNGEDAVIGDTVKFIHEGEVHYGRIKAIHEDGHADLTHVIHAPRAVEHNIILAEAELSHRN